MCSAAPNQQLTQTTPQPPQYKPHINHANNLRSSNYGAAIAANGVREARRKRRCLAKKNKDLWSISDVNEANNKRLSNNKDARLAARLEEEAADNAMENALD